MNKNDLNNLHDSDVLELLDLVREHGKNPDLWFKLSDMISAQDYVIVWQDMEFNYHMMTGSRVFKSYEDAESINRTIADKRTEVMRKRDFDFLQKQQLTNDETN